MRIVQLILMLILINIVVYTAVVGMNHGWNLIPLFFADIAAMNWQGQFNMDFMSFLILSGLWTMWRNKFSAVGVFLGFLAFFGGILFLSIYLLYLSFQTGGNLDKMMLGDRCG